MSLVRCIFQGLVYLFIALSVLSRAHAVPSTPQKPPSRIALMHMYDGVGFFRRLGALTRENKARYAARHGYDLILRTPDRVQGLYKRSTCPNGSAEPCWEDDSDFDIDHTRAPTFGKMKLALAACQNRPNAWLLWSDADAMIINQSVPLEHIIDDGYDIMLAYDWLMVQAGVFLFKCSPWAIDFMTKVYGAREFDQARALDQSSLEAHLNALSTVEHDQHVKAVPKYAINVYLEEYRPGDFLIHMAGKLYEATEPGLWAIANQFDILSIVEDRADVAAFFDGPYLLNKYSGVCAVQHGEKQADCLPSDPRRMKLKEPLGDISKANRYRHVALRYHFLPNWKDKYDIPGWDQKRSTIPLLMGSRSDSKGARSEGILQAKSPAVQGEPVRHQTAPHMKIQPEMHRHRPNKHGERVHSSDGKGSSDLNQDHTASLGFREVPKQGQVLLNTRMLIVVLVGCLVGVALLVRRVQMQKSKRK